MKKRIVTMALFLVAAMGMVAQSLEGKWKTIYRAGEQDVHITLSFGDKKVMMNMLSCIEEKELGTMKVTVDMPGTYTRQDNRLNMEMDTEKTKIDLGDIEYSQEMKKQMEATPGMEKMLEGLKDILKNSIAENKDDLLQELPEMGNLTIVELTDTKLVLGSDDDDEQMVFQREE